MNRFFIISILVLATIVTSCDYPIAMDYFGAVGLFCENNSDADLWFSYDLGPNYLGPSNEVEQFSQMDTLGNVQLIIYYGNTVFRQVKKNSSDLIFLMPTKNGWKYVKKYDYPDSLRIQVWDDALIQRVGWDEFVQHFGEKYIFELEYVIDLGHFPNDAYEATITYPPGGTEDYMRIVYP